MTTVCVRPRCGRPLPDQAYACMECGITAPTRQLTEILDLLPAATDVAYGQTSSRPAIGGGAYGPREELRLTAKDRLDKVGNALTTLARMVAEERGVRL